MKMFGIHLWMLNIDQTGEYIYSKRNETATLTGHNVCILEHKIAQLLSPALGMTGIEILYVKLQCRYEHLS